jgi:hypothetical protein
MTNGRASAAGIWHTATAHSSLWRTLAPLRRVSTAVERAVARATMPDAPADRDRLAETVFNSSWLVAAVDRVVDRLSRAWRYSMVRRHAGTLIDPLMRRPLEGRLRLIGWIVVVASATVLGLQPPAAGPDRFTWIIPAGSLAVAAIVGAGARAIAAAMERRR